MDYAMYICIYSVMVLKLLINNCFIILLDFKTEIRT